MNRYFLAHDDDMPTIKEYIPGLNYIDLGSHGPAGHKWNLICLSVPHAQPKPNWQAFPSLIDSTTTLAESDIDHETLADIGLTGSETTIQAVKVLTEISPALGL